MVGPFKAAFRGGIIAALSCAVLYAQQVIIQPAFTNAEFAGPALRLACVAELKNRGDDAFVGFFRAKSSNERRLCLDQLLRSLTPEPDFSAKEFQHVLDSPRKALTDRLGVNWHVAGGIAALARHGLIEDSAVIDPLVRCLHHPWLLVGASCNGALTALTGHQYGSDFFDHRVPRTVENLQREVAEWEHLRQSVRRPIYDRSLGLACRTALPAVIAELGAALPLSPPAALYFKRTKPSAADSIPAQEQTWFPPQERIWSFDVGRHSVANWPADESVTQVTLELFRPGVSAFPGLPADTYRERFVALDLELRFRIETSDEALTRRAVEAVKRGLAELRVLDAKESR